MLTSVDIRFHVNFSRQQSFMLSSVDSGIFSIIPLSTAALAIRIKVQRTHNTTTEIASKFYLLKSVVLVIFKIRTFTIYGLDVYV